MAVILPARNNLPYVHRATRHMLWELLERGVKVYYQPPPFVHSKLFYVDDDYAQIGSANFDSRSLRLNFEMNVEVYDRDTVTALARHFEAIRGTIDARHVGRRRRPPAGDEGDRRRRVVVLTLLVDAAQEDDMRNRFLPQTTLIAVLCALAPAAAQQPSRTPTVEERVASLEADVASIETRFGVQSARPANFGGESGLALAARVDAVERSLGQLERDLQRVERLADTAAREAAQAQRDASAAQQIAREVSLRSR